MNKNTATFDHVGDRNYIGLAFGDASKPAHRASVQQSL
jgi:hypothetical protein